MNLSKENIFDILKYFKINKTDSDTAFLNIIGFVVPDMNAGKVMSKILWEGFAEWDKKKQTILITKSGDKFIKKHKRNLKIDEFNHKISFIKNLKWIIGFGLSVLVNIFFILKYFRVF
jgi:predicted transcriptional regulator